MIKLCKDCKYHLEGACYEPDNCDPVTGDLIPLTCYAMRSDAATEPGRCGHMAAALFQPKP